MTNASSSPEFVADLVEQYRAEGYEPADPSRLPAGLSYDGEVDLAFTRGEQFVLVELKRANEFLPLTAGTGLNQLARQIQNLPNVRLDIVNVPDPIDLIPDSEVVLGRANTAVLLVERAQEPHEIEAALLLAASAAEGALFRFLRESEVLLRGPQGLGHLAATAWSEGLITQEQWDKLQRAVARRNAVSHGLTPGVAAVRTDVETLVDLARTFADGDFIASHKLVEWFFERYKDPADGVPFDSAEGGYQYVNGGPFDAQDVLLDAFPDAPEAMRSAAVDQIGSYGTTWVRVEDY